MPERSLQKTNKTTSPLLEEHTNMKQIRLKNTLFLVMSLFFMASCNNSKDTLKDGFWKHAGGHSIGDMINFNHKSVHLRNDTIFKNDAAVAIIQKLESRFLIGDKVLHIKAIPAGESGRYVQK